MLATFPRTRALALALTVCASIAVPFGAEAALFSVEWTGTVLANGLRVNEGPFHFDDTPSFTDSVEVTRTSGSSTQTATASGTASVGNLSGMAFTSRVGFSSFGFLPEAQLSLRFFDTIVVRGTGDVVVSFSPGLDDTLNCDDILSISALASLTFNTFGLTTLITPGGNVQTAIGDNCTSGPPANRHPVFFRTIPAGTVYNVAEDLTLFVQGVGAVDASHTGKLFMDTLTPGASLFSFSGYNYSTPAASTAPIPEPGTLMLVCFGLAALTGLAGRRQRRR